MSAAELSHLDDLNAYKYILFFFISQSLGK